MNKTFYNDADLPGFEQMSIETERQGVPHHHNCPKCHTQWKCGQYHCRRMGIGYIENGIDYQPVNLMCDKCAGIQPSTFVKEPSPYDLVASRKASPSGQKPRRGHDPRGYHQKSRGTH
jgi:hypothetical protein